jgi:carbon monoxide dehydrogenase subunit G
MRINGTAELSAPPERVFEALNDPEVLAATIPGCEALQRVSDDTYAMTVTAGVASIKGTYEGSVRLSEQHPPTSFTLRASGSGAPGSVDATVGVRLSERAGGTLVEYDADAVVGGMVGGVGQRMLAGVSKRMAAQFFGAVDRVIEHGVPVPAAAVDGAAAAPVPAVSAPGGGPVVAPDDDRVPAWLVPAAVTSGALWALVGVGVGYVLGRRGR